MFRVFDRVSYALILSVQDPVKAGDRFTPALSTVAGAGRAVIERDELAAWLRLLETPRSAATSARKLLAAFGSPQAVLEASPRRAARGGHVGGGLGAGRQVGTLPTTRRDARCAMARLPNRRQPRDILDARRPTLPARLLQTADPPLLLYVQGRVELLERAAPIAIVGSRNPTPQGSRTRARSRAHLSQAGLHGRLGPRARHRRRGARGRAWPGAAGTVAVVGTGLDRVYPRRHRDLAHRIARNGLLVSEFALGTPPLAAELSACATASSPACARGTLVVEAALQSGSLITARLAAEAGRDVFAIPGSIHSPQSRGCHALIKQGAKLVDSAAGHPRRAAAPALRRRIGAGDRRRAGRRDDPLLDALGYDPVTLDALVGAHRLAGAAAEHAAARTRAGRRRSPACPASCSSAVARGLSRERCARNCASQPGGKRCFCTRARPGGAGYSESMFDVLVYLYENYWRPDACPDHDQLTRKLSAVGFESDEIQEALSWLDGLASAAQSYTGEQGAARACASTRRPSRSTSAKHRSASSASSNRPACCRRRCARW